jgi:hypothetical protein
MTQAATAASTGRSKPLLNAFQKESLASLLVAALICGLLAYGWVYRADPRIDPEQGIGYKLGILGGIMMLLLLIYPFRKRIRILSAIGSVGFWFRFHMLLGLLGPVAILYHARFSWGALNSAVALGAMLVVSGSGLIGRYFYSRIHRGYSGRKLEVRALLSEMHGYLDSVATLGQDGALMRARLEPFEQRTITAGGGFWTSAKSVLSIGLGTRMAERQLCRDILEGHATHDGAPALSLQGRQRLVEHTRDYFDAVRRAAEFAFYDRMFRLWHLFHLPLFLILVVTAIIHIVAVHMY